MHSRLSAAKMCSLCGPSCSYVPLSMVQQLAHQGLHTAESNLSQASDIHQPDSHNSSCVNDNMLYASACKAWPSAAALASHLEICLGPPQHY